jgi:hypothetical protein
MRVQFYYHGVKYLERHSITLPELEGIVGWDVAIDQSAIRGTCDGF